MTRPRLLDLFSGAGGAARGYQLAGFHVTGVDIRPQPNYIGDEFHQADAMTFPLDGFDVIHASPPCQAYSRAGASRPGGRKDHPDLVAPTRARIGARPYVIENVVLAPVRADLLLCGTMFGLECRRHRVFESNLQLGWPPFACSCRGQAAKGILLNWHNTGDRERWFRRHGRTTAKDGMKRAYGIDWMQTEDEVKEAIPPAYTEWIGSQLLRAIESAA